ncbi:YaaA family protein [Schaalia suimastitidis]|uniref:YaaA family protein n=1 Tax=Schaalia suimastitidis TaxID=121163 RepID=UPI00047A1034|nr:peroxide stress protein YaaA [Schaalia suimastitidis]
MFIWLPPSEGKTAPATGPALDHAHLAFPQLYEARRQLATILATTDGDVGNAVNGAILHSPCAPARTLFSGVLFAAARLSHLEPLAHTRALKTVRIFSGLFGVVLPDDLVPDHRLPMATTIPGLGSLATFWRPHLDLALANEAAEDLILDCRSGAYRTACRAPWAHVVELAVVRQSCGKRCVISHDAKRWRGLATAAFLAAPTSPADIQDADELASHLHSHLDAIVATDAKGVDHHAIAVELTQAKYTKQGGSHRIATLVTD